MFFSVTNKNLNWEIIKNFWEKVQGVKWYVSWEPGFIFKATGEVWEWSSSINVYMRSECKAHMEHLVIKLNKFDPKQPEKQPL